jgi:hypothetical protein
MVTNVPIRNEEGIIIGVAGLSRDMVGGGSGEEPLRGGERLNDLLLDSLPHPAMLVGRNRVVLAANRIAREAGAKIGDYCWKEYGKCAYLSEENARRARTATDTPGIHCTFCLADRALDEGLSPLKAPDLEVFGRRWDIHWVPLNEDTYLHYGIDVTERQELEEERNKLTRQLFLSQKMESVGRLAGGIAHDFNNLLTVIAGNAELVLYEMEEERMRVEIEEIRTTAERASSLTRQLLAFSRRQIIEPRVLDMNEVLIGMNAMMRRIIGEEIEEVHLKLNVLLMKVMN